MELETQRVWDYAGDNYVHRLIQNKADGKLVELPPAANLEAQKSTRQRNGEGPDDSDNLKAEKMEIMAMQYSQILQRAMDDQRATYEEQTAELRRKLDDTSKKLEILSRELEVKLSEAYETQNRKSKEEAEARQHIEKERIKAEKRAEKMTELARKLEKELKEERAVSKGLMDNLGKMKEKVEESVKQKSEFAAKVADLEEQMRDLMFYVEARDKIEKGEGEVSEAVGGSIELGPQQNNHTPKKKKKNR